MKGVGAFSRLLERRVQLGVVGAQRLHFGRGAVLRQKGVRWSNLGNPYRYPYYPLPLPRKSVPLPRKSVPLYS
jgi:hypothetical protein